MSPVHKLLLLLFSHNQVSFHSHSSIELAKELDYLFTTKLTALPNVFLVSGDMHLCVYLLIRTFLLAKYNHNSSTFINIFEKKMLIDFKITTLFPAEPELNLRTLVDMIVQAADQWELIGTCNETYLPFLIYMSTFPLGGREWYFIVSQNTPSPIAHFIKKIR